MSADTRLVPEELAPLPPTPKLLYVVLAKDGPLRSSVLIERTQLPRSSVHRSLGELEDRGVVESRPCLDDNRATLYDVVS